MIARPEGTRGNVSGPDSFAKPAARLLGSRAVALKEHAVIYSLEDRHVEVKGDYFVADNATVIGSVVLHNDVSVWFNAVIRGDNDLITIGEGSNVQDGAVIHTDPGDQVVLGKGVTVGHQAMLHGCRIGDNTLIGMQVIIMDGAKVGSNCLIAAGAVILEGKEIPDNSLVVGSPGKVLREVDDERIAWMKERAEIYVANYKRYKSTLRPADHL